MSFYEDYMDVGPADFVSKNSSDFCPFINLEQRLQLKLDLLISDVENEILKEKTRERRRRINHKLSSISKEVEVKAVVDKKYKSLSLVFKAKDERLEEFPKIFHKEINTYLWKKGFGGKNPFRHLSLITLEEIFHDNPIKSGSNLSLGEWYEKNFPKEYEEWLEII